MHVLAWVFAITMLMVVPKPASALDGDALVRICSGEQVFQEIPAELSETTCMFYVRGIIDHADIHGEYKPEDRVFCLPQGTTPDNVRTAFLEWADGKELSGKSSGKSLMAALVERFPCPDESP